MARPSRGISRPRFRPAPLSTDASANVARTRSCPFRSPRTRAKAKKRPSYAAKRAFPGPFAPAETSLVSLWIDEGPLGLLLRTG
jgi:hypothetical protein